MLMLMLGPVQTPNLSWAELNANELKQKTSLIYIELIRLMKSSASEPVMKSSASEPGVWTGPYAASACEPGLSLVHTIA